MIVRFLRKTWDIIQVSLFLVIFLVFARIMYMTMIEPLVPILTFFFVLVLTIVGCRTRESAFMSVGGLVVWGMSWPMTDIYGQAIGIGVCVFGLSCWLWAIPVSFVNDHPIVIQPSV